MNWELDGRDWPNRALSRFVSVRPHRWHVQEAGDRDAGRPTTLLMHGAGASTHSWRDVLPELATDRHVVAIDLPGQGFTQLGSRSRCGLGAMAEDIATLLADQGWSPDAIIGHSAGAAIAAQLALDLPTPPRTLVSINGAFGAFKGPAGFLFPLTAKLLSMNPFSGPAFAWAAGRGRWCATC